MSIFVVIFSTCIMCVCFYAAIEGELVSGGGGGGLGDDGDGVMEGEEGGGWEVGDDDLELPPDLVRMMNIASFAVE